MTLYADDPLGILPLLSPSSFLYLSCLHVNHSYPSPPLTNPHLPTPPLPTFSTPPASTGFTGFPCYNVMYMEQPSRENFTDSSPNPFAELPSKLKNDPTQNTKKYLQGLLPLVYNKSNITWAIFNCFSYLTVSYLNENNLLSSLEFLIIWILGPLILFVQVQGAKGLWLPII